MKMLIFSQNKHDSASVQHNFKATLTVSGTISDITVLSLLLFRNVFIFFEMYNLLGGAVFCV